MKISDDYLFGGFLKVYDEFPWVSNDEESTKFVLIDETTGYWGFESDKWQHLFRDGQYDMSFINPSEIILSTNSTLYDSLGSCYASCQIISKSGDVYWIADYWEDICEKEKNHD